MSGGETGTVTSIQRFGGALNLHVHFHTLVLDGVFVRQADDTLAFHPAPPPTDADVARVVQRVRRRLAQLGVVAAADGDEDGDPLPADSLALAGLTRAAVLGRAALGRASLGCGPPAPRRRPGRAVGGSARAPT
ncbi:MAG: transposase [bacterium]|nr:transposase [bacterium]